MISVLLRQVILIGNDIFTNMIDSNELWFLTKSKGFLVLSMLCEAISQCIVQCAALCSIVIPWLGIYWSVWSTTFTVLCCQCFVVWFLICVCSVSAGASKFSKFGPFHHFIWFVVGSWIFLYLYGTPFYAHHEVCAGPFGCCACPLWNWSSSNHVPMCRG